MSRVKPSRFLKRMFKARPTGFQVGESIVVNAGVRDPDFGDDIGGWQGRVAAVRVKKNGNVMLDIEWDSQTLRQIPGALIERCQEDGMDWSLMALAANEVDLTEARDTRADVEQAKGEITAQYVCQSSGQQGWGI